MPEYQVVPMSRLMEWPSQLTPYPQYDDEFVANLTTALKQMAGEGWELVSTYEYHNNSGPGYAVFKRIR
jgi:hypothetical protein